MAQNQSAAGYNVQSYGATGNGSTDDTAAIQSAISAASANADGAVVYFPPGNYVTSSPLVVSKSGVMLLGAGPPANQGGGGSGSGPFTPGEAGTITATRAVGSVIVPSSSWSQAAAKAPAAILIDASQAEVDKVTIQNMWVVGANAGTTVLHGIAAYGKANACAFTGCGVLVLYSAASVGFYLISASAGDPVGSIEPDGHLIDTCLAQFIGSNGFQGSFGDATISRCHAQIVGGSGYLFSVTSSSGGNIRVSDCRADLGANGFHVQNMTTGEYLGMINFANCSTQRNSGFGFLIEADGKQRTCPVYLSNCTAQGDGTQGAGAGAYCMSGPVIVTLANCSSHVNTVDVHSGVPEYAFVTTKGAASSPPALVEVTGGFFNATTAFSNKVSPPAASAVSTFTTVGAQWTYSSVPVAQSSL